MQEIAKECKVWEKSCKFWEKMEKLRKVLDGHRNDGKKYWQTCISTRSKDTRA